MYNATVSYVALRLVICGYETNLTDSRFLVKESWRKTFIPNMSRLTLPAVAETNFQHEQRSRKLRSIFVAFVIPSIRASWSSWIRRDVLINSIRNLLAHPTARKRNRRQTVLDVADLSIRHVPLVVMFGAVVFDSYIWPLKWIGSVVCVVCSLCVVHSNGHPPNYFSFCAAISATRLR